MKPLPAIIKKEFNAYFASPAAWLFLGSFLIITLFIFFWAEAFFARNIADLKPLFEWMPILMIFLVAALCMRSWSEERRSGTLETLLTSPVSAIILILGKFFANFSLVAIALVLTFPLVLTVALLGPLDWGPVVGGYIATLFLAAAYISIGLCMSARTDNPIVSLILTVACIGLFYILGSPVIGSLFSHDTAHVLGLLGTGSRFDSITRGVIDVRDIAYYLSLVVLFFILNVYTLERFRWAGNALQPRHRQWKAMMVLLFANIIALNICLNVFPWGRVDLTEGSQYTLSETTKTYMKEAREPLLIRAYFSKKSHPLLEPLVPQIKNLLQEYKVYGGKHVRVEFLDPHSDQKIEEEAADKYGIRPVPFRVASRYEAGVVNSYFDILIEYGDQFETLSFQDLIDVKAGVSDMEPDVLLKNPEYEITRAIKKVVQAYRSGGDVFEGLASSVQFEAYVSPVERLPDALKDLRGSLENMLNEMQVESKGKFSYLMQDPDANDGQLAAELKKRYGFTPQVASLFDPKPFWFYMVLSSGDARVQIPLPEELTQPAVKRAVESALKRITPGYLKSVGLWTPQPSPAASPYMPASSGKRYQVLKEFLRENIRLEELDLENGVVPANLDLLILMSPESMSEKQLFAVDQFLMQGGTVVLATSPLDVEMRQGITASPHHSGLENWLDHLGINMGKLMVLDEQHASLPIPVKRMLGPIPVNEIQMMPYPHFPDIRAEGLNADSPVTSALGQISLNWVSPIQIDEDKLEGLKQTVMIRSSDESWTSDSKDLVPDYELYPDTGFEMPGHKQSYPLAIMLEGIFSSYFKGKQSPLLDGASAEEGIQAEADTGSDAVADKAPRISAVIESSSDSARLILIGSNTFAEDSSIDLLSQGIGSFYSAPVEFVQNIVDYSLDDKGLLAIRSRAQFARTLRPVPVEDRTQWEYGNYAAVVIGLGLLWTIRKVQRSRRNHYYQALLKEV